MDKLFDFKAEKKYPIADTNLLIFENYERYMGIDNA